MDTLTYFKDATNPGNIKGFVINAVNGNLIHVGKIYLIPGAIAGRDSGSLDKTGVGQYLSDKSPSDHLW